MRCRAGTVIPTYYQLINIYNTLLLCVFFIADQLHVFMHSHHLNYVGDIFHAEYTCVCNEHGTEHIYYI